MLCRWTLRDEQRQTVGYGLESMEPSFEMVRGRKGVCSFDVEPYAFMSDDADEARPQFWVSYSPEKSMAAVSGCRRLDILEMKPEKSARVVASFGANEETLDAIVKSAEREKATIITCEWTMSPVGLGPRSCVSAW